MSQGGNVPLEKFIESMFQAQREHTDMRFDALGEAFRTHCAENETDRKDHESRLRALEKQSPWRNLAQAFTGLAAAVAMLLGLVKP